MRQKKIWLFMLIVWLYGACMVAQAQDVPSDQTEHVQSFPVKTIKIQGNTLLPENVLTALVAHLAGSERSLGDLEKGAAAIQQAYRDAGYGGVVAFVPEQKLTDGDIIIQVVEGKIANLLISENERYDEINIIASLPHLRQGETPSVRDIDRNIQLANENPAKKLRVALVAGDNSTLSDYKTSIKYKILV